MGFLVNGHLVVEQPKVPEARVVHDRQETFKVLRWHPNFKWPEMPKDSTPEEIAEFVLAAVAMFVSPPKVIGENDEFACENIANAIRGEFKEEVVLKLRKVLDGGKALSTGHEAE